MPKVSSLTGVTPKQDKFCRSLVKNHFDRVKAAKIAYPNQVNPTAQAQQNLQKPNVLARLLRMAEGAGLDPDGIDIALGVKEMAYDKQVEAKTRLDSFRTLAEMLQLIGRPALIAQQFNNEGNATVNVKQLAEAFSDEEKTTSDTTRASDASSK